MINFLLILSICYEIITLIKPNLSKWLISKLKSNEWYDFSEKDKYKFWFKLMILQILDSLYLLTCIILLFKTSILFIIGFIILIISILAIVYKTSKYFTIIDKIICLILLIIALLFNLVVL